MIPDPDTKRKKIRCYKEVELRESEFKKASELDSEESCFDPFYRKGTEVYFLYFPGFMRGSYMGGVVVKKKE